jgi:hypothetical protein
MNFASLSASDRRTLIVAALVFIISIISIADRWGFGAILGLIGSLAVVLVIMLPQLSPGTALPVAKGLALLGGGALAALGFVIAALTWLNYALDIFGISNLIFDVGLVLSIVLAYFGWLAFQAEPKNAAPAAPAAPAPPPSSPPPPPAEPPAGES